MSIPMTATTNGFHESTMQDLQQVLERVGQGLTDHTKARAAFGEPYTVGERIMIPVAQVRYIFGGGGGAGMGTPQGTAGAHPSTSNASGFGGGTLGGLSVRPIAVIEFTADGIRMQPIPDVQAIITRAFAFASFALLAGLIFGARRRRRVFGLRVGKISRIGNPHISLRAAGFGCPSFMGWRRRR